MVSDARTATGHVIEWNLRRHLGTLRSVQRAPLPADARLVRELALGTFRRHAGALSRPLLALAPDRSGRPLAPLEPAVLNLGERLVVLGSLGSDCMGDGREEEQEQGSKEDKRSPGEGSHGG